MRISRSTATPAKFFQIFCLIWIAQILPERFAYAADDGSVLPFQPAPSASIAGPTLKESTHKRRVDVKHLAPNAPNILIVLMDDVGYGVPDTFGGFVHTPTLSKLAGEGISYNTFTTAAICSPTRAALLTGWERRWKTRPR